MSIADKAKDKAKRNPNVLLGILITVQLFFVSLNPSPDRPYLRVVQAVAMTIAAPVQSGLSNGVGWVADLWKSYFYLRGVREENERLKAERSRSAMELTDLRERLAAYHQLNGLVEARGADGYQKLYARVIGRDTNHLFSTVIVDKGSIHGVMKDQPVVDSFGLVGRVILVAHSSSRVLLLTDERHGAGAVIATTVAGRLLGVVRGMRDSYYFQMDFITPAIKIENGESVVTSGQDGIYPPGLLIGRVANPTDQPTSTQQRLVLAPAADLGRLDVVALLRVTRDQIRAGIDAVVTEESQQEVGPARKR